MKPDIHPNYRPVVFKDVSSGVTYLTRSTIRTTETIELDGQQYPLFKVNVSASSHPFFTGQEQHLDAAGRVEKFRRRYKRGS